MNNRITDLTRSKIIEFIVIANQSGKSISGKQPDIVDFCSRFFDLSSIKSTDYRYDTASGDIYQHMVNNDDWSLEYLLTKYLGLLTIDDKIFIKFLEQLVHPIIRDDADQKFFISAINEHLHHDGFRYYIANVISGALIYQIEAISNRAGNGVKNIIFSSINKKPDIIIKDAMSNDIEIVNNADDCLVFDQPIKSEGLSWKTLVKWWETKNQVLDGTVDRSLFIRLQKSIKNSPPEKIFFNNYYKIVKNKLSLPDFPALIPQVYLHYDPISAKNLCGVKRLPRQRMDFLLLLPMHVKIIIEIDGKQHYSENNTASPRKYAEMVKEDRNLKLLGYEVFRFSGFELSADLAEETTETFITKLFDRYGINTKYNC